MTFESDLQWIRELEQSVWESRASFSEEKRRLSEDEFQRLLFLVKGYSLPVSLISARYGFGLGIVVWGPEPPAVYPGVELRPEVLISITNAHLPVSLSKDRKDRVLFDDAWDVFSPIVYDPHNQALLRRCGLPKTPPKSAFMY